VVQYHVNVRCYPEHLIVVLEIDFNVKITRSKIYGRLKASNKRVIPKALSQLPS
jgi:hypothetical protein